MIDHAARPLAAYRGIGSRIYLPNPAQLESLPVDFMPYAFILFDSNNDNDGNVDAQATAYGATTQPEDCFITHLVGSAINSDASPGNFVLQIFDAKRGQLWNNRMLNFANGLGSAGQPFWLKNLYRLPAGDELQIKITNLSATLACAIQVVAWGVRP